MPDVVAYLDVLCNDPNVEEKHPYNFNKASKFLFFTKPTGIEKWHEIVDN